MLKASDLSARYPVWFCDIWGVVHDGFRPMATTVAALRRHRQSGGLVILVSNSPRTASGVQRQLDQIGVDPTVADAIATSGDVTRTLMVQEGGGKLFHLGAARDLSIFEGLAIERVPLDEAHAVLCTGLFDDLTETPDDYTDLLGQIRARNLTMICANPDKIVKKGDRMLWCAGALAEAYERRGGRVVMAGKPYEPIYARALALAEQRAGRALAKREIVAIGDGPETDILGAARYGIASVLVADGVSDAAAGLQHLLEAVKAQVEGAEVLAAVHHLEWQEEGA